MITAHRNGTTIVVPDEDERDAWYALARGMAAIQGSAIAAGREMTAQEGYHYEILKQMRDILPEPDEWGL